MSDVATKSPRRSTVVSRPPRHHYRDEYAPPYPAPATAKTSGGGWSYFRKVILWSSSLLLVVLILYLALIFAQALETAGFTAGIIQDGDHALARLAVATPDIVVLDLHLPHVSGADILRLIRADERLAQTRVIVATADPRMADMLQDQPDLVLLKPISFSQLRDLAVRLASTTFAGE